MKLTHAAFMLQDRQRGEVIVHFRYDEDGAPLDVVIECGGKDVNTIMNVGGGYKPCITHALEAVRKTFGVKPRSNHERTRHDRSEPFPLRIHAPGA